MTVKTDEHGRPLHFKTVPKPLPGKVRLLLWRHAVNDAFLAFLQAIVTPPPETCDVWVAIKYGEPGYDDAYWEMQDFTHPHRVEFPKEEPK